MNTWRSWLPVHEGVRRVSVAHFLVALVVLLVIMPFLTQLPDGDLIEVALVTVVQLSAVMAVGGRRRTLIAAAVLVVPALLATWIHHLRPTALPREFMLFAAFVFMAFVVAHLMRFVIFASRVNSEVLCAAVAVYLMLGILGALAYELTARLVPNSFVFMAGPDPGKRSMAKFEALYYSFGTLTPINYGDIMPVSNVARVLTMVQAAIGIFYMTILIARLVALYSSDEPTQSTNVPNPPTTVRPAAG